MAGRSVRRALAAGVVAAAVAPLLLLSGCSTGVADLEERLTALPGVSGAFVKTTASGSPTNRGYAVNIYVGREPVEDLTVLVDETLRTVWVDSAFRPTNGILINVARGDRPEKPRIFEPSLEKYSLEEAAREMQWEGERSFFLVDSGIKMNVWQEALEARYGPRAADK